jgi:hypothetical protein
MAFALLIRPVALRERVNRYNCVATSAVEEPPKHGCRRSIAAAHRADYLHLQVTLIRTRP